MVLFRSLAVKTHYFRHGPTPLAVLVLSAAWLLPSAAVFAQTPSVPTEEEDTGSGANAPADFGPGVATADDQVPNGGANAATRGFFGPVVPWPIIGLHAILLPDGRVMNYGTNQQGQQGAELVYDVWNPSEGTGSNAHMVLPNTTSTDIFCSGQSMLWGSGNVLITGGDLTIGGQRNFSNNDTTIFAPQTNTLSSAATMQYPRWYSSIIAQPDGEMLVLGGRLNLSTGAVTPEVYAPATGWRTLSGATSQAAFGNSANWDYPRAFVAPDGTVFVLGSDGTMFDVTIAGEGTITQLPQTTLTSYDLPTVMFAPGMLLSLRGLGQAVTVNLNGPSPVITPTANIEQPRFWASGTVLPDGTVLVTGGSAVANQLTGVDYTAEIWNPATGQWTAGANAAKPRLYHSIALLLPDGSVLTGAGGATRASGKS